jgi:hypothetical protein
VQLGLGRRERCRLVVACLVLVGWCAAGWSAPERPEKRALSLSKELTWAFTTLREQFQEDNALRFEARLVELESHQPELVRPFLLRLGALRATRGHVAAASSGLRALRVRAAGTAYEARAGLVLAHVMRRAQQLMNAQATYREVFLCASGRPEDRDEARAWWIRGLCEQGRHAQAREEWRAFEACAVTLRWRTYARDWLHRCVDRHA